MKKLFRNPILYILILLFALLVIYARFIEPKQIKIDTITIYSPKLVHSQDIKIVQLSDLHMKQFTPWHQKVIQKVNDQHPDLIVITGDFIYLNDMFEPKYHAELTTSLEAIRRFVEQLRAQYGIWAVRGNNDFSNDKEISNVLLDQLQSSGVHVLCNRREELTIKGTDIHILGADYYEFAEDAVADFSVEKTDSNNVAYYCGFSDKNSYSHFYRADTSLWRDFTFTGRVMINTLRGGIGVTFYSQMDRGYDKFYRLRRYQNHPSFHFSPHGTKLTAGSFDTGVSSECDTWYQFKISVKTTPKQTIMKAKVWQQGRDEPKGWQAVAFDDSPTRLQSGTVGLWSSKHGHHYFDEVTVIGSTDGQSRELLREDFQIYSIGNDADNWLDYGEWEEAVRPVLKNLPDTDFTLLLAHSPDFLLQAAPENIDLVLAGHTHGGQISLPFFGAIFSHIELGNRYARGLFKFDNTWLYVNRGLGTIYLPMRLFSPPEITVIFLTSDK